MNIQSVQRATDIISLFCKSPRRLGVTEIAAALKLHKGTAWGLVTTLEQQGFLQQDPDSRKYGVGPRLFELGMVYIGNLEINAKGARAAQHLAARTGRTVRIGIFDNNAVLITFLAVPRSEDYLSHQIGPRVPAYCSAIGKAMLSTFEPQQLQDYLQSVELAAHTRKTITDQKQLIDELAAARERGYATTREEMSPGQSALAAPIFGRNRELAGAISLSEALGVALGEQTEKLGYELMRAAADISREMGYSVG
ncbi:MAG: IclR family transcriptional regulator [Alphaproteobacteria bacterium]|nr:IclR family transcriptional regulator [Alphaproteobacteria bacterium]MDE2073364.1 IclR family transcriptional regulator [Alphaproteobacteria bacterium]